MRRTVSLLVLLVGCSGGEPPPGRPDASTSTPLSCEAGLDICASQCVDTATDPLHCGSCDNACTGGKECRGGSCVCPVGLELCSGVCTSTMTDAGHCGGCGITCVDGRVCEAGGCICPATFDECSGVCVDLESNHDNCGSCGDACSPLQTCVARECGCGDLDACPGGETGYCSQNMERHCCSGSEVFCDVNAAIGFPGGCLVNTLDCANITPCGQGFLSCPADRTPYCTSVETLACCDDANPIFCDANPSIGYDGGCWVPDVACNTVSRCGNQLFACRTGGTPFCSTTESFACCDLTTQQFCEAIPSIGWDGGCWGDDINCGSITDCNGTFVACPVGGGSPNCQGQCI